MNLGSTVRRARFHVHYRLGRMPWLFFGLASLRPGHREAMVDADTEILIEGYPRSGNTFAVAAFRMAQPRAVRIARHYHLSAHVLRAARLGKTSLVLVRRPDDAAISFLIREPCLTWRLALSEYVRFYRDVWPFRDHFVVGEFRQVTSDFGRVIERINRRFGTDFVPFRHTEENVRECFRLVEEMDKRDRRSVRVSETHAARPSPVREALKARLRRQLDSAEVAPYLAEAREVYESFASAAKD